MTFNTVPRITGGLIRAKKAEHDLPQDDRLMQVLENFHVIHLDNDNMFSEKLTWCLENCQNKFRDLAEGNGCRAWYFQNPEDAMMFAMKWS
jgi:hypothetical protein